MPGFVLLVRSRDDADPALRLGITVTKKIGNAVVRNRMKRRFRALGRELLPTLGVTGADHVLIGRESGVERDYGQLRNDLVKALGKMAKLASKSVRTEPVEVLPSSGPPHIKKGKALRLPCRRSGQASTASARTEGTEA